MVKVIESHADFQKIIQSDKVVVIDCWATWFVLILSKAAYGGS